MAAKRKELLEVRPFRDPLVRDTTSFGDDESNINQVAEHLHVEKNIAAFLPSRARWFLRESVSARIGFSRRGRNSNTDPELFLSL